MPERFKSYLEIVQDCDSLPHSDQSAEYKSATQGFYRFCLRQTWDEDSPSSVAVGFMLPSVVSKMPWISKFHVDHDQKTVTINYAQGEDVETKAISEQLEKAREGHTFIILQRWRPELYSILGVDRDVRMPRGGSGLFGIHTIGVHMLGFSKGQDGELRLWVPRRSVTKGTFSGMLDNTVGGGMVDGEVPFECLLRGARDEASLAEEWVREHAKASGTISYLHVRDARAWGELGLLQPATHHLYDLELPTTMIPKPSDPGVQDFTLMGIAETVTALKEGLFKPNSAVAWIDFLIRHGLISAENEPDYLELTTRVHRRIHFSL